MEKRSNRIPKILQDRFDLPSELNAADKLLLELEKPGYSTEAEREYLRLRISQMEKDLKATEEEVLNFLNQFRNKNRVYVCLMLHYFVGYSWTQVGDILKMSCDAARETAYRALNKLAMGEQITTGSRIKGNSFLT